MDARGRGSHIEAAALPAGKIRGFHRLHSAALELCGPTAAPLPLPEPDAGSPPRLRRNEFDIGVL